MASKGNDFYYTGESPNDYDCGLTRSFHHCVGLVTKRLVTCPKCKQSHYQSVGM